ncbi:MAG: YebC/PmpR family DNA-binding transcriptional regulator [Chlamydiota bacterium]
MAGHSKWANIKHRKERADQKKGKLFSQLTKELITAVKMGGADVKTNAKLRAILEKAKKAGLSKETIERNIKKASQLGGEGYAEVIYELYGYGGVGILAVALTDNKNRTASLMRIATNKKGGSIAAPGSVSYNFDQKGVIQVAKDLMEEDALFLMASEAGAEDFASVEEGYMIITPPQDLYAMKDQLDELQIPSDASLEFIPKAVVACNEEDAKLNHELIQFLEETEDVDVVYHNMDL